MTEGQPVVTITSDFGLDDAYVGVMKGVILQICPSCQLVDLTHNIPQGDILKASLVVRAAIGYFPRGTIHLIVVDPGVGSTRLPIAVQARGMCFVGPDNGLFWFLACDDPPPRIVTIRQSSFVLPRTSGTFHGRDIFAPVAAHLARGVKLEDLGPHAHHLVELSLPKPRRIASSEVEGTIIYVDHFGNCVSNLTPEELGLDLTRGSWTAHCEANDFPVRRFYSEVSKGAPLAVVGSSGSIELSLRDGSAAEQAGVGLGTIIVLKRDHP